MLLPAVLALARAAGVQAHDFGQKRAAHVDQVALGENMDNPAALLVVGEAELVQVFAVRFAGVFGHDAGARLARGCTAGLGSGLRPSPPPDEPGWQQGPFAVPFRLIEIPVEFLFLLLFCAVLALSVPLGICWLLYRWLIRRGHRRSAVGLPSLIILALCYFFYSAFYPGDDFYAQEYAQITGLALPASADIQRKDASYPDQHGDYAACARIKVSAADYQQLLRQLSRDTAFRAQSSPRYHFIGSQTFDNVNPEPNAEARYRHAFSRDDNAFRFVGFLQDGRTIIVYRSSS
ncbi:hypothetical protein [Hymenobacter jeollabukensis]|uniref:Uncharacterized protein n=1 Tax=Hymenobacter jeollabukensis TaxID=2025313 RepID=A0A5R8WN67_9BACT|nr:hypothetical protein [Hymenobacter jeollabukensis]TLM91076.1 hypothetical protein FDY95_15880 [Hymenobacter jeollabukensis]